MGKQQNWKKQNKFSNLIHPNLNKKRVSGHLSRERYHLPITIINIVRTKGKAGYRVWKLAGGQGDQDINLPCCSVEITFLFDFLDIKLFVANPLLII